MFILRGYLTSNDDLSEHFRFIGPSSPFMPTTVGSLHLFPAAIIFATGTQRDHFPDGWFTV